MKGICRLKMKPKTHIPICLLLLKNKILLYVICFQIFFKRKMLKATSSMMTWRNEIERF